MGVKAKTNRKLNNEGFSLVELLVVIAIMGVLLGVSSLGISMMFSRDAEAMTRKIDDELSEARMMSMSKPGTYFCILHIDSDPKKHYVEIMCKKKNSSVPGGYETTSARKVNLDKSVKLDIFQNGAQQTTTGNASDNVIIFDKSNGSVKSLVIGATLSTFDPDSPGSSASGIYKISVESTKNTKTNAVNLVATTGRHYTDK